MEQFLDNCNIPIQFMIGDGVQYTPLAGTNGYNNPAIANRNFLILKNGQGVMFEGIDYHRVYSKGIQLLGTSVFNNGEQYTIIFY